MSETGLEVFDTTVQKTNSWLKDVMVELGWDDRQRAYLALRSTLHALRDRLTVNEVAQLAAQLPMLIRGFYYEGWNPSDKPLRLRSRAEFLARIEGGFARVAPIDGEQVAHAVFAVLAARISEGEIRDVEQVLPAEIRDLWPAMHRLR
jgi:uncharacterized protein (DUF2267 family)